MNKRLVWAMGGLTLVTALAVIAVCALLALAGMGSAVEWAIWGGVALVCLVPVGVTLWVRHTKGPGRRLLGPLARMRHPAKAMGEAIDVRDGEAVRVRYEVDGIPYELVAPIAREERFYSRDGGVGEFGWGGDDEAYETTTLGDVWPGGPIGVRYRPGDPADAVLVPNPHGPYSWRAD